MENFMSYSNPIDQLIEQCVKALADDDINHGAESLIELAIMWSKAGISIQSFYDIRKVIILEAQKLDQCPLLIETKLKLTEKLLRDARNGNKPKIITH